MCILWKNKAELRHSAPFGARVSPEHELSGGTSGSQRLHLRPPANMEHISIVWNTFSIVLFKLISSRIAFLCVCVFTCVIIYRSIWVLANARLPVNMCFQHLRIPLLLSSLVAVVSHL